MKSFVANYGPLGPELCRASVQSRTEHFVVFEKGSFEEVFNTGYLREGRRLNSDGLCITADLAAALTWLHAQVAQTRAGAEMAHQYALAQLAKDDAAISAGAAAYVGETLVEVDA